LPHPYIACSDFPFYFLLYICGYLASLILTRSVDVNDILLLETLLNKVGVLPETTNKIKSIVKLPAYKAGHH
jgi:hypothetical protein